jgi:hypothetical protein
MAKVPVSRIYDAIKRAQSERAQDKKSGSDAPFERRHTPRIELRTPIYVYGHPQNREPFHEETISLIVNSHGALLLMTNKVKAGQNLLLTNLATRREQACRVVHSSTKRLRRHQVAVAFTEAAPAFWSLPQELPPPDSQQE